MLKDQKVKKKQNIYLKYMYIFLRKEREADMFCMFGVGWFSVLQGKYQFPFLIAREIAYTDNTFM